MPKKGKKGAEQRTKGNVKAASSGRMAELMGGDSGFIGFDIVSSDSPSNGSLSDDVLLGISSSFQAVLKQLGKRDCTTKLKALKEFILLCDSEPIESVISSLKLWPLMYNKLSTDNDQRVRDMSHVALRSCGSRVKKHLGPHVRSIIGPWVSGMCDPHFQSALAAQNAFTTIFSPERQIEVYKFGLKDIVTYFSNLVLKESPDTYTDSKIYPEDERVERYERAVSMAINGFGHTLKQFDKAYLYEEDVLGVWQEILSEGRLWKLSRHKNPLIRSAVFGLICSLANSTHYLTDSFKQFCPLVLGGLSERDSIVVGPLWDAVLYLLDADKEWPTHVNIQKGVLPGLWALLEGGGFGNAERVFPCLLPLLNGLMMVYSENINFFLNFLERLSKSIFSDSARMSIADTQSIIASFSECFLHILKHNLQHAIQLIDIVFGLLDTVLSDDMSMQHTVLSNGVATVIVGAMKVAKEDEELFDRLRTFTQEKMTKRLTAVVVTEAASNKLIARVGDILNLFHAPSTGSTPETNLFLPIVCEVCSVCLLKATPTNIALAQRLISHYSDYTEHIVSIISKLVRPDQPADTDQSDDFDVLVNHILSLCESYKGVEPLLVDCVVSLLCSGGKTSQLIVISKENQDLAPLILKKVAHKGHDVKELVKEITPILLPPCETFKKEMAKEYFLECLRAMLTMDGLQSLKELPLCHEIVSLLCTVLKECCLDSAIDLLSQLDGAIVKSNKDTLIMLMRHILEQVLECRENKTTNPSGLVSCYSHILCHLPDAHIYLTSIMPLFLKRLSEASDVNEVLWTGLCYRCLHCGLLKTYENVYSPFKEAISMANDEINKTLPLSVFQMFCDGDLLFSPPCTSSLTTQSSVPRSLFPCLLTGVCLIRDTDTLHDIASDRLSADVLTRNAIAVNGQEDIIIPALIYMSALAIYSNRGSPVNYVSQLSIQSLLKGVSDVSKVASFFPQQERGDGPMWSLCLNYLLHSSSCDLETWCPAVLASYSHFQIQLLLHKIEHKIIVQDIMGQNSQDVCIVTGCLLLSRNNEMVTETASSLLSTIVEKHNKKELTILDDELESSNDPMVFTVFELMIQLINEKSVTLDSSVWEFIMCQTVSVVQLLSDNYSDLPIGGVVMFCRGLSLCCEVNSILTSDHSSFEEWNEFFFPAVQEILLPFFMKIKGSCKPSEKTFLHYHICRAVIELGLQPPSDRWEELVGMIATCQLYSEQVTGFLLALRVLKTMTIKCTGDIGEGTDIGSIQSYIGSFLFNLDLDSVLIGYSDNTDDYHEDGYQYHQAVTYLLLWMMICEVVGKCDMEARVVMTEWIKERCELNSLLQRMIAFCNSTSPHQIKVCLRPSLSNLCNALFLSIARHLPPMLRQWFHTLDKRVSTQVMNFTSKNISPKLWKNEVRNIQSSKPKAVDLEVKVYSTSMEVFVAYRVDDFSIELSVCVPDCYPLLAPTIKEGKRARVDVALWRKWLLQLNAFMANQNGTLLEGLLVWKSNLDKHFAGLEDCMICFSVIHGSNYSLPKMCCRTCKKKFHSSCLYKWFSTSAKSTCPLCRNVF